MSYQNPSRSPHRPNSGTAEPESFAQRSPFLSRDLGLLGVRPEDSPEADERNPISDQIGSAPPEKREQIPAPAMASFPQRAAAKITDWVLLGLADLSLLIGSTWRMDWVERSAAFSLALLFSIPALWFTWSLYAILLNGRTVGKRLFGLEVLTDTWEPLSFGRNFGRIWAETLSGGLLGLGYALALFDPSRRTLHDHWCGTRVVLRSPSR